MKIENIICFLCVPETPSQSKRYKERVALRFITQLKRNVFYVVEISVQMMAITGIILNSARSGF